MNKKNILTYLIIFFLVTKVTYGLNEKEINDSIYNTVISSGKMISINFDSIQNCNNKKLEFSSQYTDYNRSECFKYKNNYNYFICNNNDNCDISNYFSNNSNPFSSISNNSNPFSLISNNSSINENNSNNLNINNNQNNRSGKNGNKYWFTIGLLRDSVSGNSQSFINEFINFDDNDKYHIEIVNNIPSNPKVIKSNGEIYHRNINGWIIQNPQPINNNILSSGNGNIMNGNEGNDYWWTIGLIRNPISNNSQDFINEFQMFNTNDKYYVTIINGVKSNPRVLRENGDTYVKGANYWTLRESGIDNLGSWFNIGLIRNTESNNYDFINIFSQFDNKDKFYVNIENGITKNPRVLTTNGDLYYKSNNGWVIQNTNINNQNQVVNTPINNNINRDNTKFGILYTTLHCPGITNNGLGIRYTEGDDLVYNNPNWPQAIYHWGKPQLGHYCLNGSEGESVLRKHAEWLIDAGIDYILLDATNHPYMDERSHSTSEMIIEPTKKLLQVWSTIPNAPKVVIFVPVIQGGDVYNVLLQELNKYPNMKFIYKGKPLLLNATDDERYITDTNAIQTLSETMTIRDMWALNGVGTKWQYMNKTGEQGPNNGEEISVNPAYQLSYMTSSDAVGKNNGETFKSQFSTVFANPGIDTVVISAWNSWGSIRLQNRFDPSKAAYTDSYDEDKNPDIEPQDGGKGDFYYQLMKKCISSYKQGRNSCE